MPLADIKGAQLHYEIHGAEGPTLILSAGIGGLASYWKPQIAEFSRHFRVLVYDQRGTGRSSKSAGRYSVQLLADDLIGLMDALQIERAHAVGHSTGGMLMQCAALDHPRRFDKVVLYSTRASADHFTQLAMGSRLTLLREAGVAAYHRATPIFLYPSHWIKERQQQLDQAAQAATAASAPVEIMAARIEAVLAHDQTARLHGFVPKTLVTCAKDDFLTPPYYSEALARLIPGARLAFISWGGHSSSETNADEFNPLVLSFLTE